VNISRSRTFVVELVSGCRADLETACRRTSAVLYLMDKNSDAIQATRWVAAAFPQRRLHPSHEGATNATVAAGCLRMSK